MVPIIKLGGLKLLKDAFRVSFLKFGEDEDLLVELCRVVALEKINLSLLGFRRSRSCTSVNMVVDSKEGGKFFKLIEDLSEGIPCTSSRCAVLSVFPHRNSPAVAGTFLESFAREDLTLTGLAHSNAALSAIVDESRVQKATGVLFESFLFSPYRTPMDWKLAQEGKEELYKEVVASYQEKRPKVYGLQWLNGKDFISGELKRADIIALGRSLQDLAQKGILLPFVLSCPSEEKGCTQVSFCLPVSKPSEGIRKPFRLRCAVETIPSVAVFSMNGPHFSERYGLVSDLLLAFKRADVRLIALSCAVSSISGVVPSNQIRSTTRLIRECFEVPPSSTGEIDSA